MQRVVLALALAIPLCCTQADAQARIGGPSGFGGHHRGGGIRHFPAHRNLGAPVVYPYWPYYGEPTYEAPAPTVIVVPAEKDPQPAAPIQPQRAIPPTVIEFPVSVERSGVQLKPRASTVFVFSDGRKIEAKRYTITYTAIEISEPRQPVVTIPLTQLDVDATTAINRQRGIELQIPKSQGELYLTF